MTQEISSLSAATKLTSKPRASMERLASSQESAKVQELKQFEIEMEQMNQALALVKEIRSSLESALKNLSD